MTLRVIRRAVGRVRRRSLPAAALIVALLTATHATADLLHHVQGERAQRRAETVLGVPGVFTLQVTRDDRPLSPEEAARLDTMIRRVAGAVDAEVVFSDVVGDALATTGRSDVPVAVIASDVDLARVRRLPLLRGRLFGPSDAGAPLALVNEAALAELVFAGERPLVDLGPDHGGAYEIVGVIETGPEERPSVIVPLNRSVPAHATVAVAHVRAAHPALTDDTAGLLAAQLQQALPALRVTVRDPDGLAADLATSIHRLIAALRLVSLVGLAVSGLALGALVSQQVDARRHEIGVRRAAGATRTEIFILFSTEAVAVTVGGLALGAVLSLAATAAVMSFAWNDPLIADLAVPWPVAPLAASVAVAVLAALGGGLRPAVRAAMTDPSEVLAR